MKILVVGAGFAGAVVARELAEAKHNVHVIDRRSHIAGNAYDYVNDKGIRIHKYGPHLFHTNNEEVWEWLSKFTEWLPYEHEITAKLEDGMHVPFPVNNNTLKMVEKEKIVDIFFLPYSKKMWGEYFETIDKSIWERVKTKDSDDNRCFQDTYQGVPKNGYEQLFKNILNHRNITVYLNTPFSKSYEAEYDHIFNSMAIDEYYNYKFGKLPYRSIKFHHNDVPFKKLLPSTTVNFTNDGPYTRVTEWKSIPGHGDNYYCTTITFEEPCNYEETGEKYYPVPNDGNRELYKKYKQIINDKVTFIGRCGMYVYLDMHQVVSTSLNTVRKFLKGD